MKFKRIIAILLIAVIAAGSLAGCGGSDANSSADQSTGEKIVRVSADSTPVIDPAIGTGYASAISYVNMYDTLIFPSGDKAEPWLAENWETSADGKVYTFHLKKGVKFHDGSELHASDIVFSTNRLLTIGEGFAYIYQGVIDKAEAVDDYTVKFTLTHPFGSFVTSLCRLYILNEDLVKQHLAEGSYGEFGDYGRDWLLTNDAGSGAYMAKELVQQDYFLAAKFDDWFHGWEEGAPEGFKIIYGTEPATIRTMMASKQLEITDPWQTSENISALSKLDGISIATYSSRLVQNIHFNTKLAPTDDVNFRKGLACLFDYDMLINNVFMGSKKCDSAVSSYTAGHVSTNVQKYDIEKAKDYLAKSKYADQLGSLKVEFLANSDNPDLEKVALAFQAAAKQVGITVEITKTPWVTLQQRITKPETTPNITTINSGPQYNEAGATLESKFHSKTQGTYENCTWISNDELDKAIEDALQTVDQKARFEKYAKLQNEITDKYSPETWIADLMERVAYQDYIQWPAGESSKNNEIISNVMGYSYFFPDFKFTN